MRVLNIGSLNIDKTYSVKEFVQPKETIKALKYEEFCGGKGLNQSVALAKAGAEVYHAGAVGKDGTILTDILKTAGVHTDYIQEMDVVSGHAIIQVDENGQNNIIICGGANDSVSKAYIVSVLNQFLAGDIVLLQNEISNVDFVITEAKKRGMTVALNPSPMSAELKGYHLNQVDYLIVNEVEGKELAEVNSEKISDIIEGLKIKFPDAFIILTLGEKGSYFFNQSETVYQDIFKVKAVDTTGAGDTFCGYFLGGLAEGLTVQESLKNASAASAIAVSRRGAAQSIPTKQEVQNFQKNKKVAKLYNFKSRDEQNSLG